MSVTSSLAGTLALARGEAGWEDRLPMDAGAVFASFWAVPLSLPAIALFVEVTRRAALQLPGAGGAAAEQVAAMSPALFTGTNVLAALVSWAASLLVLSRLASRGGAGWRVSPLLIGYNWSRLIVNLVAGLGAAAAVAFSAPVLIGPVGLGALVLTVLLDLGVIRNALAVSLGRAVGAFLLVLLARGVASLLVSTVAALLTRA